MKRVTDIVTEKLCQRLIVIFLKQLTDYVMYISDIIYLT